MATWETTPAMPYLGVCFKGDEHKTWLMEHLIDEYLVRISKEGHPVYNKERVAFKNQDNHVRASVPDIAKPEAKPKKKPKGTSQTIVK